MANHRINGKATASTGAGSKNQDILDNINYDKITLLGKQMVLFVFQDELEDQLKSTSGGILFMDTLSAERPRWGKVVKTTADSNAVVGDWILPESTIEQFGTVIDGLEHWRTCDDQIVITTSDKYVVDNLQDA